VPDPQDVATFEASKLSREADPELAALYAELLRARRELPPGDAGEISFDEDERWLCVRRGDYELVCNFGDGELSLGRRDARMRLATHSTVMLKRGRLTLPPLSGALLAPKERSS
jgi:maltooligosyltrehalose trehalohydrolase